jgi:TolB protein
MKTAAAALSAVLAWAAVGVAMAEREPVLKQIDLPHSYYFREMYLPQLTSGPSSVAFAPDGESLVYSMAGSLWRQKIGSDQAVELTHGPGYDYQPDWSPDGRHIVFARHDRSSIELWQLDVDSGAARALTATNAVNVEPRYSPDGKQLAYVSTASSGHFNLFVASIEGDRLGPPRAAVTPRESKIARYYYSKHDHAINPSWTPDGRQLLFVSNREVAYGTGDVCSVALDNANDVACFVHEETSWRARPEVAPDGRRVLYSSYQGRQWHQLWLTTLAGEATLPLTFGEFDITQARWSPDGRRVAYVSNEEGNLSLWVQQVTGGARTRIAAWTRQYLHPMSSVRLQLKSAAGASIAGRVSVLSADGRYYGAEDAWMHADDGFDPRRQPAELRYFHCPGECTLMLPVGDAQITAWRGQEYMPTQQKLKVRANEPAVANLSLRALQLPDWAPKSVTADLHVHMNYGGHYRNTEETLIAQARAEDLDVIYNLIVNKEQRIPDISRFDRAARRVADVTVFSNQEYHTSFWGHLGLLHLDRYLTPDFSAYQHSAFSSPYPHNGAVADLAHEQRALVGYVHPFDLPVVPEREVSLTNALPADVALGKTDYVEVVGFSDHKATAGIWYKLLNLGFRLPAGSGTDAMANYASLRGPVGMNRVYLQTGGSSEGRALYTALKEGRTVASNGPQLALEVQGKAPGDTVTLAAGEHSLRYRAALRSPVPVDHFEIVLNGRVVASHRFPALRTHADVSGQLQVRESGWIVARAWNGGSNPLILDLYLYATTSPVYLSVGGKAANSRADAKYFVHWLDRVIAAAEGRTDYNDDRERQETLDYLHAAQAVYVGKAQLR